MAKLLANGFSIGAALAPEGINLNSKPGGGRSAAAAADDIRNYTLGMPAPGEAYTQHIFPRTSGPYSLGAIRAAAEERAQEAPQPNKELAAFARRSGRLAHFNALPYHTLGLSLLRTGTDLTARWPKQEEQDAGRTLSKGLSKAARPRLPGEALPVLRLPRPSPTPPTTPPLHSTSSGDVYQPSRQLASSPRLRAAARARVAATRSRMLVALQNLAQAAAQPQVISSDGDPPLH
ncbi:hypothetical protein FA09DRAFT_340129 [Tilletiopsis washingtonensis]|uniref:Uncharacterized protein n=1 Tax=Tilletiopsis washingtonensis TaxID=58919 RepID=A0A316Z751_9BASI|nr:hypothetical protein FA09DRAFT_340129 [Tilletiopsis washingtonensis]PWN96782.1 hypothetical protein FA09DRAFT_340129 [Tilletiopsis washingtonensis]